MRTYSGLYAHTLGLRGAWSQWRVAAPGHLWKNSRECLVLACLLCGCSDYGNL